MQAPSTNDHEIADNSLILPITRFSLMSHHLRSGVGSSAPAFCIKAIHNGEEIPVGLNQYRGRWLALVFYPRDFSFVCPTELTALSALSHEFQKRNCELLGMSIDSLDSHRLWLATPTEDGGVEGLRFPLASDPDGSICKAYGIWREDLELPNRGTFLIDPEGVLKYSVVHELSVGRHAEEILPVLDALQSGGMCPANWTKADGVLDVASLLVPGRVLGHYKIEHEIGRGAFSTVLSAIDLRLNRRVAIKVFLKGTAESESRLLNEAQSVASISHSSVCTIFTVDRIDGLPSIVMEYLEGPTLAENLKRDNRSLDFESIARKLCAGLAAAHANCVVHGDLKPANIILKDGLEPVMIDFGMASSLKAQPMKSTDALFDSQMATIEHVETEVQGKTISGTPAYMSPEQARGETITTASDVFSLGVIFVEILTGQNPIAQTSLTETLTKPQQPDLASVLSQLVPEEYRSMIHNMLALDPEQRPSASQIQF